MRKILIAIPSMDMVAAGFAQSLASLNKTDYCAVSFVCGSLIYDARNKLAAQAIKLEADYVMWFDSDMTFKPDTMLQLLKDIEQNECDIVSGLYCRRTRPYTPVAFSKFDIEAEDKTATFEDYKGELEGLHEVEGVGFGCVLMKSDVIFEMFSKYGDCFAPIGKAGEDLSFCWRARQLGYKMFLDADVKCGHIGYQEITQSFYEAFKENLEDESNS